MFSKETSLRFEKLFEGYSIIGASITAKNRFIFIIKENSAEEGRYLEDNELRTIVILYNPKYHKEKHGIAAKGWAKGMMGTHL